MNQENFNDKFGEPIYFYGYKAYKVKLFENNKQVEKYYIRMEPMVQANDSMLYFGVAPQGEDSYKTIKTNNGLFKRVRCGVPKEIYESKKVEIMTELVPTIVNGELKVVEAQNPTIFTPHKVYQLKGETYGFGYTTYHPEYVEIVDERLIISKRAEASLDNPVSKLELKDIKYDDVILQASGNLYASGDKVIYGKDYEEVTIDKCYEQIRRRESINLKLKDLGTCYSKALSDYTDFKIVRDSALAREQKSEK